MIGFLGSLDHFILLESNGQIRDNRYSYLFTNPHKLISYHAGNKATFQEFCETLQSYRDTHYVAGFIPYETGYIFHERLNSLIQSGTHESVIGIYANPYIFNHKEGKFGTLAPPMADTLNNDVDITDISIRTPRDKYIAAIECIKKHIADGNTYQVNYTTRLDFSFSGSPLELYRILRGAQPTAYSALLRFGDHWILSLSPELFFEIKGDAITARPMKGTMKRGRTNEEDSELMRKLHHDRKNRAENLMIVDLLRNDIGRIARTGSVTVPHLFTVEKYKSVLQMTSTVTGLLRNDISFYDILTSLFPCGSVTGAPKLSTMQIISELENSPRGVYTGAIGMIKPGGDAVFNVPIRTIEIEGNRGSMGIGSGIVWDSDPGQEYEECLLKAQFLTKPYKPIELIESLRYENGYRRLEMHFERLIDSARYFDIPVELEKIKEVLHNGEEELEKGLVYKIRLTVGEEGEILFEHKIIPATIEQPVRLKLSTTPTDSTDRFLYHKTSRRELYQTEYKKAQAEGYFDVLFQNERSEITEGAITNVFIKQDGKLYTPPVTCGLLNGVYREMLLKEEGVREKIITLEELRKSDEMYVSNSVHGLLQGYIQTR